LLEGEESKIETKDKEDFVVTDKDQVSNTQSNFCRVNPKITNSEKWVGNISSFLIGPQFHKNQKGSSDSPIEIFAPMVYMRTSQGATDSKHDAEDLRPFRMMVYLGLKTTTVMFFKPDYEFNHTFLLNLNAFLQRQIPVVSQLLD